MPVYAFIHPETEEEIELVQKMDEPHVYVDETGVEWKRKWESPNAQIDSDIDPFDAKAFSRKTHDKKGTMGELFDQSKELSEKRKQKLGYDPVKEKHLKKYSEERRGRKIPKHMQGS